MKNMPLKIAIDCSGGIAGDMFTASLISAGADFKEMEQRMSFAGNMLGRTRFGYEVLYDGSARLIIELKSEQEILRGSVAKDIIGETFQYFQVGDVYREFGYKILETLLIAEHKAHSNRIFNFKNSQYLIPETSEDPHLHEAQDIVIDIIGAVSGMELLNIRTEAAILSPVYVGGGTVDFSHGKLSVPTPATEIILNNSGLRWEKGPVETEICTPTGAAILSSLNPVANPAATGNSEILISGQSRGTKLLPIDPLKIYLYR